MTEREQAERDEEQRQEEDVPTGQGKYDDGYAEGEGRSNLGSSYLLFGVRRTDGNTVLRTRSRLCAAAE